MKTMLNADSMHRLAKMALDSGEVDTPEDAIERFSQYRLRLHLGGGWANTLAGQACFVTALNAAARAFLGGVEVTGEVDETLRLPLFMDRDVVSVIEELGGNVVAAKDVSVPTLVIGASMPEPRPAFCVHLSWNHWCCAISPDATGFQRHDDNSLAGMAAAALGVNEAFMYVRGDAPDAGHRDVSLSLWNPLGATDWHELENRGPSLRYLPKELWLIGLGNLGQAYAWGLGMLPYPYGELPHVVLQDFDAATESNLSTCMMLSPNDLGRLKVRVVANRLEAAGFTTTLVERQFGPHHRLMNGEPTTALFGVDNVTARRDLDSAGFALAVEAGLGSGYRDFRNIRTHTFPGPRSPLDIWPADSASQPAVKLNNTYQRLADERDDLCGMTVLASRAVATPFVGALAAALVLSEVIRPLHGGGIHATLDVQMKQLRHRAGSHATVYRGLPTPWVARNAASPNPGASR